eukprot:TRINITY_DN79352_c0_g1_i1.p1 TRINITY_DN79352_c0_g1~~TRINITY_DN79352_c0_g1_i1.p1  ORF type:complete len:471 (+),score=113.47 TRINITY_DN79352_c0_g1_i1:109-1521(+)
MARAANLVAACLPGLVAATLLRQKLPGVSPEELKEAEERLSKPTTWSLTPPPPLPPRFLIMTSPGERKISYAQVNDDFTAVNGIVKTLVDGGISLPKGAAYDPRQSRLFVADAGLKKILAWRLIITRCLSKDEKAGVWGAGAPSDPFDAAADATLPCDLPWTLQAKDVVPVVEDVVSEWVSLDGKGNLYYSDQEKKSVNKIEASLVSNIVFGEIPCSQVKTRTATEAQAMAAVEEGKKEMQVVSDSPGESAATALQGFVASLPDPDVLAPFESSILQLYQASDSPNVGTPAGVAADSVQVFWANEEGGLEKGTVGTGTSVPASEEGGHVRSSKLTTKTDKSYGIVATTNSVIFSDGSYGVYGVPKFKGGDATALNEGFILSRGLCWDGAATLFVADQGANMVYAMPSRVAADQPLFPVVAMHDVFGLALIQPADPIVASAFGTLKGASIQASTGLAMMTVLVALVVFIGT